MLYKISAPENFSKYTRYHQCWSLFLNKVSGLKETSAERFTLEYCEIVINTYFIEHLWTIGELEIFINKLAVNIFAKFAGKHLCLSPFSIKLHKVLLQGRGLIKNNVVKWFRSSFCYLCFVSKFLTSQCLVEKSEVVKTQIWCLVFWGESLVFPFGGKMRSLLS